ncbi:acyl carrier protein-like protein [Obelidium mucronatum]|nr:acyl carrier protein-like protein [Obelidium mucronatum]
MPRAAFAAAALRQPIRSVRFYSAGPAPLTKEQVQERVLSVLGDFDKVEASKLTLDSHFITDLGLDSLDQVEITIAIEEEFNIELSDRDADDILTARAAAEKVRDAFLNFRNFGGSSCVHLDGRIGGFAGKIGRMKLMTTACCLGLRNGGFSLSQPWVSLFVKD